MKKILLIEDNSDMLENTYEILSLANYDVIQANNGRIGIRRALEERPDLIICDIMMPELDGYEVLHILSQYPATADIPFIFLTAKTSPADIRKGMSMGADDYITKPFDGHELLEAIEARMKKSQLFKRKFNRDLNGFNDFISAAKGIPELNELPAKRRVNFIKRKGIVFLEGDDANNIVFIGKGKVKTYKINKDGKELITGLHYQGDFIGALDMMENRQYKESAMAIDDSEVVLIPKQDFYTLLYSNHDVSIRFIHLLSNDKDEMEERLLNIAFSSVRKRVADALVMLQSKLLDKENRSSLSISRTDLSSIVGIAPETVSRTLADFRSEELIEFREKQILILNPVRLKEMKD